MNRIYFKARVRIYFILFCIFLTGCFSKSDRNKTETKQGVKGNVATDSISIVGDCSKTIDLSIDTFYVKLVVNDNLLGYANVRSDPYCFSEECDNVIATIKCGTTVMGNGPHKFRDKNNFPSGGISYAVKFTDKKGIQCMGYMSYMVVRENN